MAEEDICIGKILGAHGIRGTIRVRFFAAGERDYPPESRLRLRNVDGNEQQVTLKWIRPHKQGYLVSLQGVENRDDAERLKGAEVIVGRSELPEPNTGTYYWVDLMGIEVVTTTGERLGHIASILTTGSNDVYVVRSSEKETLVPALATVVQTVDMDRGLMRVELPEGL